MQLNVIYSKTAKGLGAGSSLMSGLSAQLMRVLLHIDGTITAETILNKLQDITELKLAAAFTQLESEGYIKTNVASTSNDSWATQHKNQALEETRIAQNRQYAQKERHLAEARAKEEASLEANLKASLAMQSFITDANLLKKNADNNAKEEAQFKPERETSLAVSHNADIKAKLEAEQIRAKFAADEKIRAEKKEIARLEIERIGYEAEIERHKQYAKVSAALPAAASAVVGDNNLEVDRDNPNKDDDTEEFAEEHIAVEVEKIGLEIKKKTKRVAEVEGRQKIIRAAQKAAKIKAKSKIESKTLAPFKKLNKLASLGKKTLLILFPAILLILILLHFINISPLVAPAEQIASETLGAPVAIEEVRVSLWPRPHLMLRNVTISDVDQKIKVVNIVPHLLSFFVEANMLISLEIESFKINQENVERALLWINSLAQAKQLKIENIDLKKIVLNIKELELAPLNGKVVLTKSHELKNIYLMTSNQTLTIQISPQASSFAIALTGTNWALPMNPNLVFKELKAKGIVKQSLVLFNQIKGTIFGGSLTGNVALDWSNQWSLGGKFNLSDANLDEILKAFGSNASVDGKLKLAGNFSCQSKLASALTNMPEITANFTAQNGKINGVKLDSAVLTKSSQSLAGDFTHFDQLTGSVNIKNGHYQYRQLVLKNDQFYAEGNVDVMPNQDISGKISAALDAQSRRLEAIFDLAGKVDNVKQQ